MCRGVPGAYTSRGRQRAASWPNDSRGERAILRRRFITIPGYTIAWLVWLAALPLWLPLALIVDLLRRRRGNALRCAALVTAYLSFELVGIAICGGLWLLRRLGLLDGERWTNVHFEVEAWWGTLLFRAVVAFFGLRIEVEDDGADLASGPYVMLLRHTSAGDGPLVSALVCRPHGARLRFVFKRELLWDPCLDIVGNRLPNAFVERSSSDPEVEIRRLRKLASDLGSRDGVVIFPEGTRFTEAKRSRLIERLRREGDDDALDYASSLRCSLPPRVAGTLAMLDEAPEADVVLCSQTGLEGAASPSDIWAGALVHETIHVQFRRVPRAQVPTDAVAAGEWLRREWKKVDAWAASHREV